jgi:hypothetical protein
MLKHNLEATFTHDFSELMRKFVALPYQGKESLTSLLLMGFRGSIFKVNLNHQGLSQQDIMRHKAIKSTSHYGDATEEEDEALKSEVVDVDLVRNGCLTES